MTSSFYIAWHYVIFNRVRSVTLVACITLIAFLPFALQLLLAESQQLLQSRATSTPLLLGARGSALDLVMNSLYFDDEVPERISMLAADEIADTGLGYAIPLYVRFLARNYPIVATSIDYFDFRGLAIADGRMFTLLGESVIGADVAEDYGLAPGDSIVSSPETLFDLAGIYPLKMTITGVLERSHTPDDRAVFVDLKTAWVIEGLGHGHEDLGKTNDSSVILKRTEDKVIANAKLLQYTQITTDNIDSFHFHGDASVYPVTAVLAVPHDAKSATLLRGRYLDNTQYHIVRPTEVIEGLLESIFRIKTVIDSVIAIVGLATVLAIILVFALSVRLRQRELSTIFKLGCSRMTAVKLIAAEIAFIVLASSVISTGLLAIIGANAETLVRMLIFR
ncbi:MAG: ABC transporter permease [Gammaproteobacteria bacterium]|nr:ABC transporter permease [Gammaproteobacteria bacterium]NNJ97950.1 ABC transporter permease [Gammaproteobacteria bacterium]